ncbi:TPA: LPXTG cell wall anchor domain-containing protein [Streptococcus equi subsp. zooepidemicus]|nr:LPXTG cell wall anchor domain-containing protein [Streptococcus equi subsp. zooepidemicus]HEL0239274.1 LPXTG cell wall anchor domain-containing protein [Streptococcus equi subsp. zooepidemicus]HEL0604819.1 LPXTG cell wall anchor domain-containing protein [Streptococcus equi subsp. zooepidemicus]HEL0698043.1 LPXTG cell wall anchor domain-containing protein [Streptococcus equi subsp. zooepidemicus]HEL0760554.1 LPXTG cell wall anchor domain-containing protein [Streptococcus equi subsp. zooepide
MPEVPKAPETPEKKEQPQALKEPETPKAPAPQSAPNKSAAPAAQKGTLPATGEANHPFFTLAALSVIASAGVLGLKKKQD